MYAWLIQNELDEYADEFTAKKIDGKLLLNLDGSRLKVGLCALFQNFNLYPTSHAALNGWLLDFVSVCRRIIETVCRTEEISCSIFKCEKERNSLQGDCRKTWCIWFWLFFPPTPPPPFSAREQSLFIACGGGGRRIVGITWVLGERSGNWGSVVANCQWGEMIRISLNLTGDRVNLSWHKHHPTPSPPSRRFYE